MSKIKDFLKSRRPVIIWTVCYVIVVWAVLRFLFNFEIFELHNWVRLTRFHLRGFGGLVFGMFILAAVPLYFATTVVVARTKTAPVPFKIPLPRWLKPETASVEKDKAESVPKPQCEEIVLPEGAPKEMRESFIRARRNANARHQYSVFNKPEADKDVADANQQAANTAPIEKTEKIEQPTIKQSQQINLEKQAVIAAAPKNNLRKTDNSAVQDTSNGLPLPDSFDVESSAPSFDTPVFSDINFDDDDNDTADGAGQSKTTKSKKETEKSDNKVFKNLLDKLGIKVRNQNGLFVSDKFAIAVHDDDDLWIADDIDWFAAGKQKPSPIAALKNAQTQYGVTPVLFLDNTNIMDSETLIATWRTDGIQVAQNADELQEILTA